MQDMKTYEKFKTVYFPCNYVTYVCVCVCVCIYIYISHIICVHTSNNFILKN